MTPRFIPYFLCFTLCCSSGHLPDRPSERDPVADGAEDLIACYLHGRVAQIHRKELPGAR